MVKMSKYEFSSDHDWIVLIGLGKLRKSWADLSDESLEDYPNVKENRDFIIQRCDEVAAEINAQRPVAWDIVK
jgi:hypothetical protein